MNKNTNNAWRMIFLVSQLGITMLATIFFSLAIGYLIDKWLGTHSMLWFIIIGILAGFRSSYVLIRRYVEFPENTNGQVTTKEDKSSDKKHWYE